MASAQCGQRRLERLAVLPVQAARRQRDQHLPLGMGRHVVEMEHAAALGRAPLAEGEQAAETTVGGAVAGIAEERESAGEVEPRAGQEPQTGRLRCNMGSHCAGEGVAISDADGGEPERSAARATNSSAWEAPRRKLKLLTACSSAYAAGRISTMSGGDPTRIGDMGRKALIVVHYLFFCKPRQATRVAPSVGPLLSSVEDCPRWFVPTNTPRHWTDGDQ